MVSVSVLSLSTSSSAQIGSELVFRPHRTSGLPVYAQPICPGPGYLWTPVIGRGMTLRLLLGAGNLGGRSGRHALDAWILGVRRRSLRVARWILGTHVGFYGGVNYGFGFGGVGFEAANGEAAPSFITAR